MRSSTSTSQPSVNDRYEDRYTSLGHLFYSVAACDRKVVQAELTAFKEMIDRHWMLEDRSLDEVGVESVRYMDIAFDEAHSMGMPSAEAFAHFEADQLREPDRYDGWTKSLILKTAMAIAQASAGVNASEVKLIGRLQQLLAEVLLEE